MQLIQFFLQSRHNTNLRWLRLEPRVFAGDVPAFFPHHFSPLLLIFLADAK